MANETKTKRKLRSHPQERIEFVEGIFLKNSWFIYNKCTRVFFNEIAEKFNSNFNISLPRDELYYYVAQARKRLIKIHGPDKKKIQNKHKENLNDLLISCRKQGDIKLEFCVLKEMASLEDIYPDKNPGLRNEVVIKKLDTSKLTERQIDRIIAGEDTAKVLMSPNE